MWNKRSIGGIHYVLLLFAAPHSLSFSKEPCPEITALRLVSSIDTTLQVRYEWLELDPAFFANEYGIDIVDFDPILYGAAGYAGELRCTLNGRKLLFALVFRKRQILLQQILSSDVSYRWWCVYHVIAFRWPHPLSEIRAQRLNKCVLRCQEQLRLHWYPLSLHDYDDRRVVYCEKLHIVLPVELKI